MALPTAMVSLALFFLANTFLGLASGTPVSTSASTSAVAYPSATYCSPPAATRISLTNSNISTQGGAFPPGPMELGLLSLRDPFLFWAPPAPTGSWNLVKNGSLFLVEHSQVPGLMLTADQGGADAQLATGPVGRQQWNITCTTCPDNGFANNCSFANSDPFPNFPQIDTRVCILNQRLRELGNATLVGQCPGGVKNNTFQIDYHL
ncbi:hypothetical protein C8F04DRAFT_1120599 [Mycena alexandri]|uniref:Uncharacterized protein n=1 Tax=Mycena alexandri TaxID=1745969 RepID=A0AAD6X0V2_9AGAR|nr:hypothetical protein C8F04DRAFT_1120599 [Mycena alexandri]